MTDRYLLDNSVWQRMSKPAVREVVEPLADRGLIAVCGVIEMEFLHAARNAKDRDTIRDMLRGFDWLPANDEVWQRAIDVKCKLIDQGNHRAVGIPDLIIAATAERHRVTVMHYDGDFDMIAAVTGQDTRWVVPPGTADA